MKKGVLEWTATTDSPRRLQDELRVAIRVLYAESMQEGKPIIIRFSGVRRKEQ